MPPPMIGMTLVLVVFITLLLALRTWQHKAQPDPEWVRKLLHIGMGLYTLALPWLFADAWPVVAMGSVMIALLLALRWSLWLRQQFGSVLGDVARQSHGELYFALGVIALFVWAKGDPVSYVAAMLVLTFADAAAALVGKRWGAHHLFGTKSLEGSLAFLLVALLCLALPLALLASLEISFAVLLALTIAVLLTGLEAVAARGLDNLLLPLATYWLLTNLSSRTSDELRQLRLLLTLSAAVWAVKRTVYQQRLRKPMLRR